jgi:ribosome biogenesis GTPase
MQKGRVIQSTGSWYLVDTGEKVVESRLPGRFRLENKKVTNPIAVGDLVDIALNDDGSGSIEKIYQRENYITRQATHGKRGEQILVSNLDQACVVQSIKKPQVKEGFIDRFLVTCEAYEVKPVIIINKMDLAKSGGKAFAEELRELYTGLGYEFLTASIEDDESLKKLKKLLEKRTSAFIGPSGVGKTSLINAIDPSFDLKVNEVSDFSNKGKHTTTFARLIPISFGGYIADTPGIREFGLVNIEPWELSLFFPEMLEPREYCQFSNCTHAHEPKCGVAEAYKRGEIAASRYQSYLNMLDSL